MPKASTLDELDHLVQLIADHPDGIGIDTLLKSLGSGMQRRTLQRRLALLVEQHRIQTLGEARAVRYRLPSVTGIKAQAGAEACLPTSAEGEEIRRYVRQPRQLRRPVAYRLDFLEQYHPNPRWPSQTAPLMAGQTAPGRTNGL